MKKRNKIYEEVRIDWFDTNNATQMAWATEYLANKRGSELPHNFRAHSSGYFLQLLSRSSPEFLRKMRDAWRRQRLRKSPDAKKNVNFTLHADTKDSLDAIAKAHGVSQNEVIERLIKKEGARLKRLEIKKIQPIWQARKHGQRQQQLPYGDVLTQQRRNRTTLKSHRNSKPGETNK